MFLAFASFHFHFYLFLPLNIHFYSLCSTSQRASRYLPISVRRKRRGASENKYICRAMRSLSFCDWFHTVSNAIDPFLLHRWPRGCAVERGSGCTRCHVLGSDLPPRSFRPSFTSESYLKDGPCRPLSLDPHSYAKVLCQE